MLTYSFLGKGLEPLYIYLYKCIRTDIIEGKLSPGEKLPSKRSFSKNLGISIITVENAYSQLLAEGYIYSVPKSGYYVENISQVTGEIRSNESRSVYPLIKPSRYIIDFVNNYTPPDNFPFSIWAKILREIISKKSEELMLTSPSGGIPELRISICEHLRQFRNMEVSPEQVIVGAGTEYLYNLLIQLLRTDKIFAIENPGYKKIAQIYKQNSIVCRLIPIDQDGIIVNELEKSDADIVHITPSHHFPTGVVSPIYRRNELIKWAYEKKGRYIIEDDYDSELRLDGRPIPTLQSMDKVGRVIYINTFTKTLTQTIRISYMILPMELLGEFYDKLGFYSCTVSNFEQFALARFMMEGFYEKHINRLRKYYRDVRDELLKGISESSIGRFVEISEEKAGLHFLMKINTEVSDEELIECGRKKGINLSCLSDYYDTDTRYDKHHTLIMNYSGIVKEKVPEALELLVRTIEEVV